MKKIIFIAPYPKGEAPSQRFRFEQYIDLLIKDGYEIQYESFIDIKTWGILYSKGNYFNKTIGVINSFIKRWILILKINKSDIVFIHREMSHIGPPIFEFLLSKVFRRKYIFDFDDAIWLPNFSQNNAKFHKLKAYWKVKYCIKWAFKISAGNSYLAKYALKYNANVTILPTTIDLKNHHNKVTNYESNELTIGWTGTHTTMHYLDFIIPILEDLEKDYKFTFVIISNQKPSFKLKSLKFIKWTKESEIQDLATFNVGIMPLTDDIWSQGKCGFKGLQYMSLGIPTIMSPVGVNKQIVTHNINGLLANTSEEWKSCLIQLIENKDLRILLGKNGLQTVMEKYSVDSNYSVYKNLIEN